MNAITPPRLHCSEAMAVQVFLARWARGAYLDLLPWSNPELDLPRTEQAFNLGRADVVLYHADGTATVVEAKDGSKGYSEVAKGIGQASFYATQLRQLGTVSAVRGAVMWTSVGKGADEVLIEACHQAGVTPIHMGNLTQQMRTLSVLLPMAEAIRGAAHSDQQAAEWLKAVLEATQTKVKVYGPPL
jgi:hypothetical protein